MNKYKYSITLILIVSIFSCSTNLDSEEFIDTSLPFHLKTNTTNSETGITENNSEKLSVNSTKWIGINEWFNKNKEGWETTPASYIGDTYITQGEFRMIYTKNSEGVIISFEDSKGKQKQYSKEIGKDELNFLYKE